MGRAEPRGTLVTPGSDSGGDLICGRGELSATGAGKRLSGGGRREGRRVGESKAGATGPILSRLRISKPALVRSTKASATSATTRLLRTREWAPALPPWPPCLRELVRLGRAACTAGKRPTTMPVTTASANENNSKRPSR